MPYYRKEKSRSQRDYRRDNTEQVASEKNILPEVAALLVGKECNVDIKDSFELVENKILRENEE